MLRDTIEQLERQLRLKTDALADVQHQGQGLGSGAASGQGLGASGGGGGTSGEEEEVLRRQIARYRARCR